MTFDEFAWLETGTHTGLENKDSGVMREGMQAGKDRIWWTDGDYLWFRRCKSNPETLARHNRFVEAEHYVHIETQGDVEVYQLQPESSFKTKDSGQELNVGVLDNYNVRRQAALAACKRDWQGFRDIVSYMKERITAKHYDNPAGGHREYAEIYMALMESIHQRQGPSPQEINKELLALQGGNTLRDRVITLGRT